MNRQEFRDRAPLPYPEFVALCALLMASTALAIDIVLPAMLVIGGALGAQSENAAQLVITAYLVPYAVGQLLLGPLSDSFGRKPIMLAGLAIYAVASALSIFATSFEMLLVLRGVAGFGAASGRAAVSAVVRDCYAGRDMASIMSLVMMVFMVVPILAPLLGQALLGLISWHAIFWFMALFGVVLVIWIVTRLPETLAPENRRPFRVNSIIDAFKTVVSQRASLAYALGGAVFFGSLFGFVNSAPQIYIQLYDLGSLFPLAFSAGGLAVAAASLINSSVVQRLGMRRLSHLAIMVFLALGLIMTVISGLSEGKPPLWVFIIGTIFMFTCFGFIGTNFSALALEPLGAHAGMASAVFGFLQMGLAGILGAIIGQFYNGTTIPLFIGFLCCGIASLGCVLWAERGRLMIEP
ncbi:MAG: multidrug effflux MFS transporter [Ahrensia sp.]|nr:multidrug effflux MFS transporter [Ahrensia sp.]